MMARKLQPSEPIIITSSQRCPLRRFFRDRAFFFPQPGLPLIRLLLFGSLGLGLTLG